MAFLPQRKVRWVLRLPSTDGAIGTWLKKELYQTLQRMANVLDWAVDFLGKAGVDSTDEPGVLRDKIVDSATVQWTVNGDPGARTLSAQATGIGIINVVSDLKSYLFPAKVTSGLDCGQVACCYRGYYTCDANLFIGWTEVEPGLMVKDDVGPLTSWWFDGVDPDTNNVNGSTFIGKTVMAFQLGASDPELQGPYIVEDVGCVWTVVNGPLGPGHVMTQTHATLRRHPSWNSSGDFSTNMAWQVQTGNVYGTKYLRFDTATPITLGTTPLSFSVHATNPNTTAYELLTAAQLADAETDTVEAQVTLKDTDGYQSLLIVDVPTGFETRVGTPGAAIIAAGKFTADVLAKIASPSAAVTTINFRLLKDTGASFVELFSFNTSPVTSSSYAAKQISQAIAEQDIAGCRLVLNIRATTTSATNVTVSIIVNDMARSCRISLPIELAVGVITDHRATTNRDAADQHPWSALEPVGQAIHPMPPLTIAAGGKLTLGAGNTFTVNPNGLDLTQISVPSCPAYTTVPIRLIFTAAVKLQHAQVPSSGFAPLYLHRAGSVNNPLGFKYEKSVADFVLVGGEWILTAYHGTQ